MKNSKNKGLFTWTISLMTLLLICGCGKEKTGFFAKKYHNTTARYNRFYHGNLILEEAKEGLKLGHTDNFNEILKVYALGDVESFSGNASQMDEIVKKAANIIDKHPRSKWIDNTYLLIGKSHFYKGDFFSAIDVFNFVFSKYRDPKVKSEAQLWIAKSYFMQEKYLEAEALLTKIEIENEPTKKLRGELYLVSAAVALEQNKKGQAVALLEKSVPLLKRRRHDLYRYHYIMGQLYEQTDNRDSALEHYQKVKKYNPPYEFEFNSKLKSAKLLNGKDNNKAEGILNKMLRDDKNIDYFDQIYYELALINLSRGNKPNAIKYFELSASKSGGNSIQKSNTFLALGDLYFEIPNYKKSQAYYDSAGLFLEESHPKFAELALKNEVLGDLIVHLITISKNDSLLKMANDEAYREKMIDEAIKRNEISKDDDAPDLDNLFRDQKQLTQVNSSFPFYNTIAKAKGYNDFVAQWGRRPDTDNWRISSLQRAESLATNKSQEQDSQKIDKALEAIIPNVPEDRKKYYIGIPLTASAKSQVNSEIEVALFEAGKIYKDGLNDYPAAIESFEELFKRFPNTKYAPAAHYFMMICYQNMGKDDLAANEKRILLSKYPEDDYTKVATAKVEKDETKELSNEAEKQYIAMYKNYKNANYAAALSNKEAHDEAFMGDLYQIKFDYLEALVYGASGEYALYEEKLKNVATSYPETEIGKDAQAKADAVDRKNNPEKYKEEEVIEKFKITMQDDMYFLLKTKGVKDINRFKSSFSDYNRKEFSLEKLELTSFIYNNNEYIILVKNFSGLKVSMEYLERAKKNSNFTQVEGILTNYVLVSKEDFDTILEEKAFDEYKEAFSKAIK